MTLRDERSEIVAIPDGVTAGYAVFDRETGQFVQQHNADHRFRSASVVKLLIVLDYLWDRAPAYDVPAGDRMRPGHAQHGGRPAPPFGQSLHRRAA
jgi:hypothetical protein